MKTYLAISALIVIVVVVREYLITLRRPQQKRELRHHIDMITHSDGCNYVQAERHYEACKHIIEYYGIELKEVGDPKTGYIKSCDGCIIADLADLYAEVDKSSKRAGAREYAAQLPLASALRTQSSH